MSLMNYLSICFTGTTVHTSDTYKRSRSEREAIPTRTKTPTIHEMESNYLRFKTP